MATNRALLLGDRSGSRSIHASDMRRSSVMLVSLASWASLTLSSCAVVEVAENAMSPIGISESNLSTDEIRSNPCNLLSEQQEAELGLPVGGSTLEGEVEGYDFGQCLYIVREGDMRSYQAALLFGEIPEQFQEPDTTSADVDGRPATRAAYPSGGYGYACKFYIPSGANDELVVIVRSAIGFSENEVSELADQLALAAVQRLPA